MASCFLCILTSTTCSGDNCPFRAVFGPNVNNLQIQPFVNNIPNNVADLELLLNCLTKHHLKALLLRRFGNLQEMIRVRDTLVREARWRARDPLLGICGRLDHVNAQLQAEGVQNANLQVQIANLQAQLAEAGNQGGDDNEDANDAEDGGVVE